jgi:hypothetical protein
MFNIFSHSRKHLNFSLSNPDTFKWYCISLIIHSSLGVVIPMVDILLFRGIGSIANLVLLLIPPTFISTTTTTTTTLTKVMQ